ncbi:unnamed protein product, partial [Closterium sp. NIES-54]
HKACTQSAAARILQPITFPVPPHLFQALAAFPGGPPSLWVRGIDITCRNECTHSNSSAAFSLHPCHCRPTLNPCHPMQALAAFPEVLPPCE